MFKAQFLIIQYVDLDYDANFTTPTFTSYNITQAGSQQMSSKVSRKYYIP